VCKTGWTTTPARVVSCPTFPGNADSGTIPTMQMVLRRPFIFLLGSVLLVACAQPEATQTTISTATPIPTPGAIIAPAATAALLPVPTPTQSETPLGLTPAPTVEPTAVPTVEPTRVTPPPIAATLTPTAGFQEPARPLRSRRIIISDHSLWAGHPASRTVTRLALTDGRRVWQSDIGCEPATLARAEQRLFVACFDTGEVLVLDDTNGNILARRWVGHGPFGLLAVGERLYVSLAHDEALLALSADGLSEIQRVSTERQPRGLAMLGHRLYVVHLLDASLRVFDAHTMAEAGEVRIGLQGALAESVTLHPNRERAYIPHQRQNVSNMALLFDSTVFPVVSVLDTKELLPIRREAMALDSVDTPVSMPTAVVLSPDGRLLYTVNAASDDVSVVDLDRSIGVGHVVVGQHPRDLALSADGKRLYTLNLVSDDISVVDTNTLTVVATFPLADDLRPVIIQEGERIWLTSRPDEISRDNWMACASCHFDTGFDGQTWLGTVGGPRNTPIVRGIEGTEPLHWSADMANVQSFEKIFTGLMAGTGLSEPELDALAAYLDSLEPIPSPHRRRDGALNEAAVQGSATFKSSGCAVCHSPPKFTDRQLHDVGTGEPFRDHPSANRKIAETLGPAFDTPSLRELWLTAPFLHDGRAATLRDVLTTFNTGGQHGRTSGLSEAELAALEAFLLSLPLTAEEVDELFGE